MTGDLLSSYLSVIFSTILFSNFVSNSACCRQSSAASTSEFFRYMQCFIYFSGHLTSKFRNNLYLDFGPERLDFPHTTSHTCSFSTFGFSFTFFLPHHLSCSPTLLRVDFFYYSIRYVSFNCFITFFIVPS